ncbi:hypothetical protein PCANC_06271 [Puccinia coronata f. sp. avenae]|uniref:Amino acid permease/ SLC12A domain-containing protein n=1 Tax=Puccinia coronata f. sp. avenae TaxID=200324 RepID=A0A2N5VRM5_9BASI|nr:hypothetical protein PCANC_06271 [Puccinia coronata f. sp. avenae]
MASHPDYVEEIPPHGDRDSKQDAAEVQPCDLEDLDRQDVAGGAALCRSMKTRHIQMISIGGMIGTGLFLGTGESLANGGPLGLMMGFEKHQMGSCEHEERVSEMSERRERIEGTCT